MRSRRVLCAVLGLLILSAGASAQTSRDGKLVVTVLDPSGAVVRDATVRVVGDDTATKASSLAPVKTSERGLATVEALSPGRYTVQAEFQGFDPGLATAVRIRSGENKLTITLKLRKVEDTVTVARDAQAAAADPRGGAFGASLTREEIMALSNDRAEMARQLQEMAGGNAVIRVGSFFGAPLPPKSQIKSIHIKRDLFAAENHSAESDQIEIITQPGQGPLEGSFSSRFRDGSMSGKSPFTPTKGPERTQTYEGTIGGSVVKDKSSFSLAVERRASFDTPILNVALPDGNRSEVLGVRRPNDVWASDGLFDYALTRDQIVRMGYDHERAAQRNQGIGAYDLPERAYSSRSEDFGFRLQETGPLGRRIFQNTRFEVSSTTSSSTSAVEAQTIRINDASVSGGAQLRGGRRSIDFELASDVDYIRGLHSVRAGALIESTHSRSDASSNYLGTYTFSSNEAFVAGLPTSFTRRIGNPLVEFWTVHAAVYVQDDIRIRKWLTLSPGLRYEAQTFLRDYDSFGPRFGLTFAPFKSGRTTLRASSGIFYNWLSSGTYEQTLRLDGFRQQELNIRNPTYPLTDLGGTVPPTNRYLLGGDLQLVRTVRASAGIDQTITPRLRFSAMYSHARGAHILRGRNLNAPVAGIRPNPAFANIIETLADAASTVDQLATNVTINLTPPGRAAGESFFNWRRTTFRVSYTVARSLNNTDGAFSVPASGTLSTEWAAAGGDRRHRATFSINTQAFKHLSANISVAGSTGTPYTITTGLDENGDLLFNDRPAGTGRNSVRTTSQWTPSANLTYTVPAESFELSINVSIANLTNHTNYSGFSGVKTSPFFLHPTSASGPRRIDFGMNISF
jgi:carboxypeptidase family protein